PLRRRCRRATGAPALGALRAQRRTRPQSGRSIDSRRRLRPGGHGSGRYAARHRAPHLAGFLVPPAPRRGTYTGHAGFSGAAIQRQDLRVAGDRVRPPRGNLVRRAFRLPPAARDRGARSIHPSEEAMFACLHGTGNLTALAFEFSPSVEATAPDTVTFDVSGLDRIFGLPQDIAGTIARRAREIGVKANLALAGNPDAAICAARGFSGVSLIPHGDEGKFLAALPLALLSPAPQLLETLERWGIRRFHEMAALPPLGIAERLRPGGLGLRRLARGRGAPFRRRDRAGLPGGTAGAARLPAGPPDQRLVHAPGHPRPRYRRTPPAPQTGNRRYPRTLSAPAGPLARYQGVPQTPATRSGSQPARRADRVAGV